MIHFTHFQTFPKIPKKVKKFQSRDKIPKSESTGQDICFQQKAATCDKTPTVVVS